MMIVKFAEAAKLWVTNIRGVLNEILTDLCSPFILYRNLEDHHNCLEPRRALIYLQVPPIPISLPLNSYL